MNADPRAIGKPLTIDGQLFTVIGVLPTGFNYLRDYDLFLPMGALAADRNLLERGNHAGYYVIGRPRPGASIEVVTRELQAIETSLVHEHPATNSGLSITVQRLSDRVVTTVRQTIWVLFGAVGFLLLVACVNVANLLIARGAGRQHELAVRAALGGGRARLARQLLVESTVLSAAGGALGVALGAVLLNVLLSVAPDDTPRLAEVTLDRAALLFGLAAAAVCGIVFGALPAFQASKTDGQQIVVRARASAASAQSHRLRRTLVVVQVALSLVLLTAATLMMRTVRDMMAVDHGFDADAVFSAKLSLQGPRFDPPRRVALLDEVLAKARAIPGVRAAAAVSDLPMEGSTWNSVFAADGVPPPARREDLPSAAFTIASAGYFETMGIRVVRGRGITDRDSHGAPVVVVNDTMARQLWPGQNPIGRRVKQGWPEQPGTWREIVGVVHDVTIMGVADPPRMQVYLPFVQVPPRDFALVIRLSGPSAGIASDVEAAVHASAADVPVYDAERMEDVLTSSIARERMATAVLTMFGAVALILAAVGLYGLVSHGVIERRHEIGVRMALGATQLQILRLIVGSGLAMAAVGSAVGVGGAMAATRSLQGLLFGVTPNDPPTLGGVVVVLLLTAGVACLVPGLRAIRIPPSDALRA